MSYNAFDMMDKYIRTEDGQTTFTQQNLYDGSGKRIRKEEIREKAAVDIDLDGEGTAAQTQLEKIRKTYIYQGDTVLESLKESRDVTGFTGNAVSGSAVNMVSAMNLLTPGGNILASSRRDDTEPGSSESWYTYNTDYQGSTLSIVNAGGDAVSTYEYDDYGSLTESSDDIDNEICYTGQIYDEGTGLYYYNARYYDAQNACFTSMDTYRGDNSFPLTLNLYMYCGGNPINLTDPTGHWFFKSVRKLVKRVYKKYVAPRVKKAVRTVKRAVKRTVRKAVKKARNAYKRVKRTYKKAKKAAKNTSKKVKKTARNIYKNAAEKIDITLDRLEACRTAVLETAHELISKHVEDTARINAYWENRKLGIGSKMAYQSAKAGGALAGKLAGAVGVGISVIGGIATNRANGVDWSRTVIDAGVDMAYGGLGLAAGIAVTTALTSIAAPGAFLFLASFGASTLASIAVNNVKINGKSISTRTKEVIYDI